MSRLSPPPEQWVSGPPRRPTSPSNTGSSCGSSGAASSISSSMREEREKNQQRQRAQDTADRKQLAQLMLEVARVKAGKHTPTSASGPCPQDAVSNSSDDPPPPKPKQKRTKQAIADENALFERLRDERLARKRQREEEERQKQQQSEQRRHEKKQRAAAEDDEVPSDDRTSSKKKQKKSKKKHKHERKRRQEHREEKRERKRMKREEEEKQRRLQEHSESRAATTDREDEVAEVNSNSDADSDCSSSSSVVVLQEPPRSSTLAPLKSPSIPHSTSAAFIDLTGAPRTKYVSSDDVCSVDLNLDSRDRKAMKKQIKSQAKRHKTHLASVLLQSEQNDFVPLMEYCEEHALEFGFQTAMYKHYSGATGLCYQTRMRALETAVWSLPASLHLALGDELYRLEMRRLRNKLNDLVSDPRCLADVDEDVAELMRRLVNEMLMAMLRASFSWKSIVHLHADAEQPLQQEPVFKDLNVEQFETIKNNYFQDKKRKKISAPTQAELNATPIPTQSPTATVTPRVTSTGTSFDVTVHHSTSNQTKTPVRPRITAPTSPLPTTPPPPTTPASTCCKYCGCTKVTGSSSTDASSGGSPSPARTNSHHTSSSSASSLSSTPSTTTVVLNFAQSPNALSQQHQPPISLWNPFPHWQHPQLPMPALSLATSQPSDSTATTTKSRKARSLSSLLNASTTPGGYLPFGSLMMQPSPSPFYYSPSPLQYLNAQVQSRFPYGTSFVPTTPVAASIPATAVASTPVTPKAPKIRAPTAVDTFSPAASSHGPLSPSNHTSFEMPPAVLRVKSKESTKSIRISTPVQKQSHSKSNKHQHNK